MRWPQREGLTKQRKNAEDDWADRLEFDGDGKDEATHTIELQSAPIDLKRPRSAEEDKCQPCSSWKLFIAGEDRIATIRSRRKSQWLVRKHANSSAKIGSPCVYLIGPDWVASLELIFCVSVCPYISRMLFGRTLLRGSDCLCIVPCGLAAL